MKDIDAMWYEFESLEMVKRRNEEQMLDANNLYSLRKCCSISDLRLAVENEYEEQRRFVDLTQKKLRSLHVNCPQNGLRNKVLLEAALKKMLNNGYQCDRETRFDCEQIICDTDAHDAPTSTTTTAFVGLSSPRKRSFSSVSLIDANECSLKRIKPCSDMYCEDMAMVGDDNFHANEQLYANLATFFHRLKTQQ